LLIVVSGSFMELARAYEAVMAELQDLETCIDPVSEARRARLRRRQRELQARLRLFLGN